MSTGRFNLLLAYTYLGLPKEALELKTPNPSGRLYTPSKPGRNTG